MTETATDPEPGLPPLDLEALAARLPGLGIGTGDHVRIAALVCAMIERGEAPASRADWGPLIAPLLARDGREQDAIHAFYADPGRKAAAGPEPRHQRADLPATGPGAPPESRLRLAILAVFGLLMAAGTYTLMTDGAGIDPANGTLQDGVERVESGGSGLSAYLLGLVADAGALVAADGLLRSLAALLPIGAAAWLLIRLGNRRAMIDPQSSDDRRSAEQVPVPQSSLSGYLQAPWLTAALGRLRLRREIATAQPDARRTTERAVRNAGLIDRIVTRTDSRMAGHLVLIDRFAVRDHLGELGDLVLTRLSEAGVPVQAYDLLADPGRMVARRMLVGPETRIIGAAALADQHRDDLVLVICEAARALNRRNGQLAPWLAHFGEADRIAVLTPVPRADWGPVEGRLAALGVALFPLGERGLADYAAHREASFIDKPRPAPVPAEGRSAWTVLDALAAIDDAEADPDLADEAVFALRAALSPSAFDLLSVLSIFPVRLPELTVRMRAGLVAPDAVAEDEAAILAELATLPWFRASRMPFWLRCRLVADLPPRTAETARRIIRDFQDETGTGAMTERSLAVASPEDRITRFLGLFGPRTGQRIAEDAIFVGFIDRRDVSGLAVEASRSLTRQLDRAARVQAALIAGGGLIAAAVVWLAAPSLLELAGAGLSALALFANVTPAFESLYLLLILTAIALVPFLLRPGIGRDRLTPARTGLRWGLAGIFGSYAAAHLGLILEDYYFHAHLTVDLFLLLLFALPRRQSALDPVAFAVARPAHGCVLGLASLLAANVMFTFLLWAWEEQYDALTLSVGLLAGSGFTVLAAMQLTTGYRRFGPGLAKTGRMTLCLLAPATILPLGFAMVVTLVADIAYPGWQVACLAAPLPLTILAMRSGLIRVWHYGVICGAMALALLPARVDQIFDPAVDYQLSAVPALALAVSPFALLHRHLSGAMLRQSILAALYFVGGLAILAVLFGAVGAFAQTSPTTPCDPASLTGQVDCPNQDLPKPSTRELPVIESDTGVSFETLVPAATLLSFAFAATLWMALRRAALIARGDRRWRMGNPVALLALPVFLLGAVSLSLTDLYEASAIFALPLLAVFLTWRCGWWGFAASVLGLSASFWQTGIAPAMLFGGAGFGTVLSALVLCRLVGERGALVNVLALDRMTWVHYAVLFALVMPVAGFQAGDIAMRIEISLGLALYLGLFLMGLSRISLAVLPGFLILTGIAAELVSSAVPARSPGLYFDIALAGSVTELAIALMVAATGRALRRATIGDLGPDPRLRDGPVMAALTGIAANPWVLLGLTVWGLIPVRAEISGAVGGALPGILPVFAAFTLGLLSTNRRLGAGAVFDVPVFLRIGALSGYIGLVAAGGAVMIACSLAFGSAGVRIILDVTGVEIRPTSFNLLWLFILPGYTTLGMIVARRTRNLRNLVLTGVDGRTTELWQPIPAAEPTHGKEQNIVSAA